MTGTELDEILADDDQQETTEQTTTETTQTEQTEGPARDETGRFAAKEAEGEQETEQAEQSEVEGEQEQGESEAESGQVPQQALHASRQREKEAKQEAEALRSQLQQMAGQIEMLSRQVTQPREQPKKAEDEQVPDFWEDPDAFVKSAVSPVEQKAQQQFEQFSKMMAVEKHGQEMVDTAFKTLGEALQTDPTAQADYQKIMANPHPFGALVDWYSQRETLKRVGSDPEAFFESEFERRMAEDPEFAKKAMAKLQGNAQQNTNRSEPVTKLPPSLGRLPAGVNQPADDDVSDAALFSQALG